MGFDARALAGGYAAWTAMFDVEPKSPPVRLTIAAPDQRQSRPGQASAG